MKAHQPQVTPNPSIERTAQRLRLWVPFALRAPAAAHVKRLACTWTKVLRYEHEARTRRRNPGAAG